MDGINDNLLRHEDATLQEMVYDRYRGMSLDALLVEPETKGEHRALVSDPVFNLSHPDEVPHNDLSIKQNITHGA